MNTKTPTGAADAGSTPKAPRATRAKKAAKATPAAEVTQQQPKGRRQQKIGRVASDKMQKTIVVSVESLKRHPVYKRTYKYTTRFKAHDENNTARIGDTVRIEETRPLSREKHWRLVEILKRAEQTVAPEVVEAQLEQSEGIEPTTGER